MSQVVRKTLEQFGVTTTLTNEEIESCLEYQRQNNVKDIVVIGKAGSGKDTAGEIIMKHRPEFGTDSMADDLKKGAYISFQSIKKDRPLLQGLSYFRELLPSCYLDNVWRRILYRRTLTHRMKRITSIETPSDVVYWWRTRLFPVSDVSNAQIESVLQRVYDERFGDGRKWWSLFQPLNLEEVVDPIQSVVLTDCRFPNEFFLGYSMNLLCMRMICSEENRIDRLRKRDGEVDESRFNHISERALDFVFEDRAYKHVADQVVMIDNNGTEVETEAQILVKLSRAA